MDKIWYSDSEAAAYLGLTYWSFYHYLRTGKLHARESGTRRRHHVADLDRFAALLATPQPGLTITQTARHFGVSRATAYHWMHHTLKPVAQHGWRGGQRYYALDEVLSLAARRGWRPKSEK